MMNDQEIMGISYHCTFIGGYLEKGACPWASSNAVIPNDQMSALENVIKNTIIIFILRHFYENQKGELILRNYTSLY